MPKPKELINKWFKPVQAVVSVVAPVWGVGLGIIDTIFIKPKEKTMEKINGHKTKIGIFIMFASVIAKMLGYDVPLESVEGIETSINDVFGAFGMFMISIGAVHKIEKATKK